MQSEIQVSIIIPIYNVEQYIADCLKSVIGQTMTVRIECIIVDDCGQDGSMHIVEEIVENYSGPIRFTILHHAHNMGLSVARNTGMRAAQGKYIYFLDSDDTITTDCIEYLYTAALTKNYDCVVGKFDVITTGSHNIKTDYPEGEYIDKDVAIKYSQWRWTIAAWNKLYKAEFIKRENLRFEAGLIHEDELWSLEVAAVAKSVKCLPKVTYHYLQREGSIMSEISTLKIKQKATIEIHHDFIDFLQTRGILYKPGCFLLYMRALITALHQARQSGDEILRETLKECVCHNHLTLRDYLSMPGMNPRLFVRNLYAILPQPFGIFHYKLIRKILSLK